MKKKSVAINFSSYDVLDEASQFMNWHYSSQSNNMWMWIACLSGLGYDWMCPMNRMISLMKGSQLYENFLNERYNNLNNKPTSWTNDYSLLRAVRLNNSETQCIINHYDDIGKLKASHSLHGKSCLGAALQCQQQI
jgi:hypothetical protein